MAPLSAGPRPITAVRKATLHRRVALTVAATITYDVIEAVMPFPSWLERRTGRELGSASVVADSRQTLLCT